MSGRARVVLILAVYGLGIFTGYVSFGLSPAQERVAERLARVDRLIRRVSTLKDSAHQDLLRVDSLVMEAQCHELRYYLSEGPDE